MSEEIDDAPPRMLIVCWPDKTWTHEEFLVPKWVKPTNNKALNTWFKRVFGNFAAYKNVCHVAIYEEKRD